MEEFVKDISKACATFRGQEKEESKSLFIILLHKSMQLLKLTFMRFSQTYHLNSWERARSLQICR